MKALFKKTLALTLSFSLIFGHVAGYAQVSSLLNLPAVGAMFTASEAFVPVLIKGITLHPENPFLFDFIIDSGNSKLDSEQMGVEAERLIKYFLASMTIPEDNLWVNLSPYEEERIIYDSLNKTELGQDMLMQDYLLKQLTASLFYPENELGKKFWDKIYKQAYEKYGTTEVPINTFNKVWILPDKATVFEQGNTVYIVESSLKVLLDEDYLALNKNKGDAGLGTDRLKEKDVEDISTLSSIIVRELIIPEIEKEINKGKNFAKIRQIYNSLILAKWYKETIKESILSRAYVDQNKVDGIDVEDKNFKEKIYKRYLEAYTKGVYNYIKEEYSPSTQDIIPRKHFSGGIRGGMTIKKTGVDEGADIKDEKFTGEGTERTVIVLDAAMLTDKKDKKEPEDFLRKVTELLQKNSKVIGGATITTAAMASAALLLMTGGDFEDKNFFEPTSELTQFLQSAIKSGSRLSVAYADDGTMAVTLSWDPNLTDPDLEGFKIYMREKGGSYGTHIANVPAYETTATIEYLDPEREYVFAVTTYDYSGQESEYSDEVYFFSKLISSIVPEDNFNALERIGDGIGIMPHIDSADTIGTMPGAFFNSTIIQTKNREARNTDEYYLQTTINKDLFLVVAIDEREGLPEAMSYFTYLGEEYHIATEGGIIYKTYLAPKSFDLEEEIVLPGLGATERGSSNYFVIAVGPETCQRFSFVHGTGTFGVIENIGNGIGQLPHTDSLEEIETLHSDFHDFLLIQTSNREARNCDKNYLNGFVKEDAVVILAVDNRDMLPEEISDAIYLGGEYSIITTTGIIYDTYLVPKTFVDGKVVFPGMNASVRGASNWFFLVGNSEKFPDYFAKIISGSKELFAGTAGDTGATKQGTKDSAMLVKDVGGIDMEAINVEKQGTGIDIQFDPAQMQKILQADITGLTPVVIEVMPIKSVFSIFSNF